MHNTRFPKTSGRRQHNQTSTTTTNNPIKNTNKRINDTNTIRPDKHPDSPIQFERTLHVEFAKVNRLVLSRIGESMSEPLPLSTWSLSAEPQSGELSDVPPMGSFDVVVIDGCQIPQLAREALNERCWVLTSRMFGLRTDITKDWIRLRLKPSRITDSQLVSVEVVVVESALCPEGSVGLAFDGSCLRFSNAAALNPSMN